VGTSNTAALPPCDRHARVHASHASTHSAKRALQSRATLAWGQKFSPIGACVRTRMISL